MASHRIVSTVQYIQSAYLSKPMLAEATTHQIVHFQMGLQDPDTSVMARMLKYDFESCKDLAWICPARP